MSRFPARVHRHRHLILLLALLFMALVQPLARGILVGLLLYDVFFTLA